jgi:endonuclease/exonuclease/phosphatase family metal-dependent hydrolase
MPSANQPPLRFAWWNVHNFAHYDINHAGEDRWPIEQSAYDAKCERVDNALRHLINTHEPDILGLGEITSDAAEALRMRLFPNFKLVLPEITPGSSFQVAVLYRREIQFRTRVPLLAANVPRTTRGMAVVEYARAGHRILFIFCHWTAFGENSDIYRERLAETAAAHAYEFINNRGRNTVQHVVILGDFNTEPFDGLFRSRIQASRDRDRSRRRVHFSDQDVRRVRFYNASWRLLGERHPHDPAISPQHLAGTYYNNRDRTWHTYDQVLVTSGLLGGKPPYLEEASFNITPLPGCLGKDGKPEVFNWSNGIANGLSDHLPLTGRIVFPTS